jgi:histidine ammonia-lyase
VSAGAPVELSSSARDRIRRSRDVIEQKLAAEEPTYGLNRGLGHNKDTRISIDELTAFSLSMLRAHAGGFGSPLPADVVRAAMLARVCGIARGGSGASPAMPETLVAMLNAGVTPVVPEVGSVGAGDLSQMATIGLVAIGEGLADHRGERMSGAKALERAAIDPLSLGPKDGLTLMSANGISVGHGALVAARTRQIAAAADVVVALSLEAIGGNMSVVDPAVGMAKPFRGQIDAADHLRAQLDGSFLHTRQSETVQESLSFRVIPQVHGALREVLSFAVAAVETELNSPGDNPLVTLDGRMVHNGNFEPLVTAIAFDALRIALAHVGHLSDRRMSHLWEAIFKSAEAFAPGRSLSGIKLRYPAAARITELKQLAAPATLDVPTLDMGVEDHGTGAPLSVSKTESAVNLVTDILAVEVLLARDLLPARDESASLGIGTRVLMGDVDRLLAEMSPASDVGAIHAAVRATIASGRW